MNRLFRLSIIGLIGLVAALAPLPATAHNAVVDREPAPESDVTESPVTIRITTSDALLGLGENGSGNLIQVTDESGRYFGDGCVELGDTSLESSVALGEPGVYTVAYQFVSADGHSLSESYTFTFTPGPEHAPAPGSENPPVCGQEALPAPPAPEDSVEPPAPIGEVDEPVVISPAPEAEANPWLVGAGFALAAIALGVLAVWLVRRRR